MILNKKAFGVLLLGWLNGQPSTQKVAEAARANAEGLPGGLYPGWPWEDTAPFFECLDLPYITGYPVVDYLKEQNWVEIEREDSIRIKATLLPDMPTSPVVDVGSRRDSMLQQDAPSLHIRITPSGMEVARANHLEYEKRQRDVSGDPLTKHLLQWLYTESTPVGLVNFLASDYAACNKSSVTLQVLQKTARYLHEKGFITDPGELPKRGLSLQRIELTEKGCECHDSFHADVMRCQGGKESVGSINIHVEDSTTTNISVGGGSAAQNVNMPLQDALAAVWNLRTTLSNTPASFALKRTIQSISKF